MKGKIYCIYHNNKICYVGSTTRTLERRWINYRSAYNNIKQLSYKTKMHTMMRTHGIDNFEIELLEEVEVEDKRELFSREGAWMDTFQGLGIELYNTVKAQGLGQRVFSTEVYQRRLAKQREKIQCPYCGEWISRMNMKRHQRRWNCIGRNKKTPSIV